VASSGGLDKFRASAFVKIPLAQTSYGTAALAAADDGSVVHRDHAGTLWVGGQGKSIYHRRGNRWIEWRADDGPDGVSIQAIVSQPNGTLWVSILRAGVYQVIDNRWILWGGLAELPRQPATALALDFNGRLWLGYVDSRIAVVDQGRLTVYDAADGLSTGAVQVIAGRGRNIWIGGEKGLNWFDGRRFHSVQGNQQHAFANVTGVIEKAHGDLWLNTSEGAALIQAGEVRKWVAEPSHPVQFLLFNHLDGMPGAFGQLGPTTAVESTDGRIWMSTTNGVVTLAPRRPPPNPIVPSVYIKSITVDGAGSGIEPSKPSTLQLSSNPHVLQISYTAPSFAIPERVNFKYRLEGSDMGWQDVGTRREAYFTGLPPGSYRFQVIASNDSGVWNETGASLNFIIPPTFLQSRGFIVMCVVTASAALWLLFVLRMRQVKAQLLSRNEERLLERERIARDLHDTFLQGVQGLMLRFQSATERIPEDAPARKLMEDALDRADRVLAEGRDKVSELRASVSLNLPEALMMVGNELSRDYAVSFQATIEGVTRELNPLVQEEASSIAAEALTNAFRHARATNVGATVVFGRRRFEIRVVDDGSGFDVSNVKPGRWGLKGMRERAGKIRGKILVSSQPGVGTTVELHIPAKLAYRKAAGTRWSWRGNRGLANTEDPT
jgi:signal transduction histidine kinase